MSKVYVDVLAEFSRDGVLIPKSFRWTDGIVYQIDKITDKRRAASLKAGGVGMRYTCIIGGQQKYLYYEDNNMWFMEGWYVDIALKSEEDDYSLVFLKVSIFSQSSNVSELLAATCKGKVSHPFVSTKLFILYNKGVERIE